MDTNILSQNLFGKNSGLRFHEALKSVNLDDVPFLHTKTVVQQDHSNGAPNSSFPSTYDGALLAVGALAGHVHQKDKMEFRLFGNVIRENYDTIKSFYRTFIKKK